MQNSQALEIAESVFEDFIKRKVVGGDYEERALETIRAALSGARPEVDAPDTARAVLEKYHARVQKEFGEEAFKMFVEDGLKQFSAIRAALSPRREAELMGVIASLSAHYELADQMLFDEDIIELKSYPIITAKYAHIIAQAQATQTEKEGG